MKVSAIVPQRIERAVKNGGKTVYRTVLEKFQNGKEILTEFNDGKNLTFKRIRNGGTDVEFHYNRGENTPSNIVIIRAALGFVRQFKNIGGKFESWILK